MRKCIELFLIFSRIGAVTFGGGYAMLPILQKELVVNRKWVTEEEVMDYYAISQCTPGIIAVNTAIFIGYKSKKEFGAIFSALGIVFPSIVIILLIACFLQNFMTISFVQMAFVGVRIAVGVLVANAAVLLMQKGLIDRKTVVIFGVSLAILLITRISPIPVVIGSALIGIVIKQGKI